MNLIPLYNRGVSLVEAGMYSSALEVFDKVLKFKPSFFEALYNRGCCLQHLKRYEEAVAAYRRALLFNPKHVDSINNLGVCLNEIGQRNQAAAVYQSGLNLDPNNKSLRYNSANALLRMNRFSEAMEVYTEALKQNPNHVPSLYNMGNALRGMLRYEESLSYYQRVLEIDPAHIDAQWNLGLSYLVLGNLKLGLPLYEKGIIGVEGRTPHRIRPLYYDHIPLWEGQSLEGKSILLYPEQGMGDVIQCLRYALDVRKRAAKVYLAVPAPLRGLMAQFETENCHVLVVGQEYQEVDYQCSLVSLPFALQVREVDYYAPYLKADPRKIQAWQGYLGKDKIGLAWSGNPAHPNDARRSMALSLLSPIYQEFPCVSLQKEIRTLDQQVLLNSPIRDVKEYLTDFTDTAALLYAMRVVVTVDTSIAHLAGALGRPVWMMIPKEPDWRWFLDRQDTPWYPTMRIFRQAVWDDWGTVVDDVVRELRTLGERND